MLKVKHLWRALSYERRFWNPSDHDGEKKPLPMDYFTNPASPWYKQRAEGLILDKKEQVADFLRAENDFYRPCRHAR